MAIFDFKSFNQLMQGRKRNKIISIALHSFMLILCLIGSVVFLQDAFYSSVEIRESENIFDTVQQTIWVWIGTAFSFIKIKIIIPAFIIAYFYFCISQNVFHNLFKDDYNQKYNKKYNKIHQIDLVDKKKSQKQASLRADDDQSVEKSFTMNNNRDITNNKQLESSLNMSMQMVKSMSKSMMGSVKSIAGSNLNQSMSQKPDLSMRSSKVIQNIAKKTVEPATSLGGKDLMGLFAKGKNLSQSFISQSSSGMEGDQGKIKIKAKRYYQSINQKHGQQFKKWYIEAILKYKDQIKTQNQQIKNYQYELSIFKKGLEREFNSFLKEYRENYDALKECLMMYWRIKIQGFESKKPLRSANQLSNLFKQNQNKIVNSQAVKTSYDGVQMNQKQLLKRCSSSRDFLDHLSQLKVQLRNKNEKDLAQKQLSTILSKMRYLNTLLNISCIEGQLLTETQNKKIKLIERCLNHLVTNKIDIFSLYRVDTEFNDLDLFEEYDIETIKILVQLRTAVLIYLVNKINLMSDQKHFKVKMNQAVTYDSGYLASALQFFKNKNFAEIVCQKGTENIFTHFNLKMMKTNQEEQGQKETLIYCKPGIDNSISAAFFLVKEISQELNRNLSLGESLSYEEKRRQKSLRDFVESFYVTRRF